MQISDNISLRAEFIVCHFTDLTILQAIIFQ